MELDYRKLGFKCGLEVHQQLETHKLFCSCPSLVRGKKKDVRIERYLRASAGETGKVDIAAKFEMEKGKRFIYLGDSDDVCLVELDEEPPHPINQEALEIALQVAKMMNANIVDEIQVMRKVVVDGSNVSGFQRTMLIGTDGFIETSKGKVRIPGIYLEEEACQKLEEDKNSITWGLDRLGISMMEIATDADIKDAEHAKETAEKIGMIMRSTEKAKRGIGTIRQDVNMSIKGHPRVEVKGFQDLKSMPKVIENEVKRELKEMKSKKKLEPHVRKANADGTTDFMRPMPGEKRMYPETDIPPIKPEMKGIKKVELIQDKAEKIKKMGLGKDLANLVAKEGLTDKISAFAKKFKNVKPAFIAETMLPTLKELKRKFNIETGNITDEHFEAIFAAVDKGEIAKDSVIEVLKRIPKERDVTKIIKDYAQMSEKELEKELKKIVDEMKNAPFGAVMGKAMGKFKGKASGQKISEILKKLLK
ncbi:Glu-tRNA(Gln) amidotransferase subunit GatE [Candidatus Woesearchaeota archaeon]|nr:Glu-tRNA(Gln) amidotransferase subunit GatE [Candidatus Woesearchaeota archaeon]